MGPNSIDSNPKFATSRWNSLAKTYKICDKPDFHDEKCTKKQKSPFFRASAEFTERRREKMGTFVFFKKYKIRNNDSTTILDSENTNDMMPSTKFCSNPTDGVPGGSVTHIGSP